MAVMSNEHMLAASAAEIAVAGAADARQAPSEILLMPAGEVRARPHDGRPPWYNRDADAIVAATQALKAPIAIDYEHQGVRSAKNGQPAPAAGWIKRTFARDGAVWGEVEWTGRAKAHIEAREYRFISPVFRHHRQTRAVTRIEGAALVNDPALHMRAIAGANGAAGAGLETEDDEENPMTGRKDNKDTLDKAALAAALGLNADADEASILVAAKTAAKGATALAYAKKDPDGFADYIKAAPAIVTPGRVLSGSPPAGDGGTASTAAKAGLAIPAGRAVDAEQLALHERAMARARADKIDYAEAAALEEAAS